MFNRLCFDADKYNSNKLCVVCFDVNKCEIKLGMNMLLYELNGVHYTMHDYVFYVVIYKLIIMQCVHQCLID